RFETMGRGMILRDDGCEKAVPVTLQTAPQALMDMMGWFLKTNGNSAGRMAKHLRQTSLPPHYQKVQPPPAGLRPPLGRTNYGHLVGVAFGQLQTDILRAAIDGALGLRLTPWRMIVLAGGKPDVFITDPQDPLMRVHACPGAPGCPQGMGATRAVARAIAPHLHGQTAHISGCTKGCAHPKIADITITATANDTYALARRAAPWDTPEITELTPKDLIHAL
ncbi:MAG: hypothetical protein AAF701_01885, partial [Pseudomonadota bacterium]